MKKLLIAATLALFCLSSLLVSTPSAVAEERSCTRSFRTVTFDNLRVPQGRTGTFSGTDVKGNIVVERDATLNATGVQVIGSVQAEGARCLYRLQLAHQR